ncbi:MAG: DM13 domain-containing protein [Chloroflexota bacterium]|nr:DM13 domain-containing protein [Chloroflexota bacterium]
MRKRNIFIIAVIVILIPVVAFAWWLLSPLFLSTTVDEEFPFAANAEVPANMTMAEVETVMETMAKMDQEPMAEPMPLPMRSDTQVIPSEAVLTEASPEMREAIEEAMAGDTSAMDQILLEAANAGPPPEPVALASGSFRDADSFHRGSGTATIYLLPDGSHLLRLEDFEVTNGPDLRVLLAEPGDPMSRDELQTGGYTHLAKLKGNIGNQNYEIPSDINLDEQNSVIIYCMPFHVIFSVAPLEKSG